MSEDQIPEVIRLTNDWRIGDQLGRGGFGSVYLAWSENREPAVVKLIPKAPGADRELLFEDLSGVTNVVPVLDSGEWGDYWVLAMPKAEKSLRDYLVSEDTPLPVHKAVEVLIDVAEALVAIDGHVIHRDIKPDNILLLNGHWCLADFGISRYAEATTAPDTRKYAMTSAYASPEQWRGERATNATDVYATGVIAYELLAGRLPFSGPDYRHQHLEDSPDPIPSIPPKLQSLVSECLIKASQARPSPQNLLSRLNESLEPASGAAQRLQQANQNVVQQQAEADRKQSVARAEGERRNELREAADTSLGQTGQIVKALHEQVVANAPASTPRFGPLVWSCSLNGANFGMDLAKSAELPPEGAHYLPPFDVIAFANITLGIPRDMYGYEGRSHSLWYCDAHEKGVFRWYETAFMISPFMRKRASTNPFALEPGQEAYRALSNVITDFQVARSFTPIDQGSEEEFIERWMGWFADAAEGRLEHPSYMPEGSPQGSWRRE